MADKQTFKTRAEYRLAMIPLARAKWGNDAAIARAMGVQQDVVNRFFNDSRGAVVFETLFLDRLGLKLTKTTVFEVEPK